MISSPNKKDQPYNNITHIERLGDNIQISATHRNENESTSVEIYEKSLIHEYIHLYTYNKGFNFNFLASNCINYIYFYTSHSTALLCPIILISPQEAKN